MVDLETVGNIRFEEGKHNEKWFTSCIDLLTSRFNAEDLSSHGIYGLKILRITRIHNRFLRQRFEDFIEANLDTPDLNYKKFQEYLFYGVEPKQPNEMRRVMEEGF